MGQKVSPQAINTPVENRADLGGHLPIWRHRPRAATGEFLAQNLDLARPPPRLQDGYMGKRSEALGRSNGQNGMETCLLMWTGPTPYHNSFVSIPMVNDHHYSMQFPLIVGPKWLERGSKWAHVTCLCTPKGPRSLYHYITISLYITIYHYITIYITISLYHYIFSVQYIFRKVYFNWHM